MTPAELELQSLLLSSIGAQAFQKAVFSKPQDPDEIKTVLTWKQIGGKEALQAEKFCTDNKAKHENLPVNHIGFIFMHIVHLAVGIKPNRRKR